MTESVIDPRPVALLAPDDDTLQRLRRMVPDIESRERPLEALAEMAAAPPRAVVMTMAAIGYRQSEILGATRSAVGAVPVYLVCRPEQELDARALEGVDDYFIAPFGLRDLAARLRDGADTPADAPAEARDHEALDDCLRAVTERAGAHPGEIAETTVEMLASFDGITSAAVLIDKGALPLATSDADADWSTAGACWADGRAAASQWTVAEENVHVFVAQGASRAEAALAVRFADASPEAQRIDDVTVVARTALALVASARVREAALRVLATDAETGLASRRYFDQYLEAMLRRAGERHREVTLAVMSPVSNSLMGRTTLQALADLLKQTFPSVKAARIGPETLGVCLAVPGGQAAAIEALHQFAERVQSAALPVPVAMGSATFPWHASDAPSFILAAEERLTRSREAGVPVFD